MFVDDDAMNNRVYEADQYWAREDGTWRRITKVQHKKHDYTLITWQSPDGYFQSSQIEFDRWAKTATLFAGRGVSQ